jgi:hypothetical protein
MVEALLDSFTVYHAIGITDDGRSHHYDPDAHQVVVCKDDQYHASAGISSEDIDKRVDIPEHSTGAWDYIAYVRDETELSWDETFVDEQPPEDSR